AACTFRGLPVSTTYDQHSERSQLSLDWVLSSGIPTSRSIAAGPLSIPCLDAAVFTTHINISVSSSLPCDLVLGRDWLQYCRECILDTCFLLSSGPIDLRLPSLPMTVCSPMTFKLVCARLLFWSACSYASDHTSSNESSNAPHKPTASTSTVPMNNMPIPPSDIIHDIFLGHHSTRARTSVFHADLPSIQHALSLHGIPHQDMTLMQCRRALIHHIITGTCFDNPANHESSSPRPELATCRA
ncbi:hypothetical protein R3P38DRAFT_3443898, partial [Favolaschia claudopus]